MFQITRIPSSGLQVSILGRRIEARTRLPRIQVPVPHDQGFGILPVQSLQQLPQRGPLFGCACVRRCPAVRSQSADVAHADAVPVVVSAMGSDALLLPSGLHGSVCGNHVVIPAARPAQRSVVAVDVLAAECASRPVGGAVHDDQCNASHHPSMLPPAAPPMAPVSSSSTKRTR